MAERIKYKGEPKNPEWAKDYARLREGGNMSVLSGGKWHDFHKGKAKSAAIHKKKEVAGKMSKKEFKRRLAPPFGLQSPHPELHG